MNGLKLKFDATLDVKCLCTLERRPPDFDLFLEKAAHCPMHGGDKTAARVRAALAYLSDVQHERDATDSLQHLLDAVLGMKRAHAEAMMAGTMSVACARATGFGAMRGDRVLSRKVFPMMDVARAAYEGMLPAELKVRPKKTTCADGAGECTSSNTI